MLNKIQTMETTIIQNPNQVKIFLINYLKLDINMSNVSDNYLQNEEEIQLPIWLMNFINIFYKLIDSLFEPINFNTEALSEAKRQIKETFAKSKSKKENDINNQKERNTSNKSSQNKDKLVIRNVIYQNKIIKRTGVKCIAGNYYPMI